MADRLPRAKIDEMWLAFQRHGSAAEVARTCHAHPRTVARVRRVERWDERLAEIRTKAQATADSSLATALAESMVIVKKYKRQLEAALAAKNIVPDDVTASELERIIRLEIFLHGAPENRTEIVGRFAGWSDDELEAYARGDSRPR